MNDIVVFAGPSLARSSIRERLAARWLPPAAAADITRICASDPRIVVILDTACGWRPGPRHRELLAALARGITIHGASGGGALLAVELQHRGMHGHGQIFARYRQPDPPGDDAVLCDHDPQLDQRRSEPLIQLQHVLTRARRAGILTSDEAAALRRSATHLHWRERSWPRVCAHADHEHCLPALLACAAEPGGDLPGSDAEALLQLVSRTHNAANGATSPVPCSSA